MPLRLTNCQARHLLVETHGLAAPPTGAVDVTGMIKAMGFVQLDTIRAVSRAHHHILWSRNQNYREPMLWKAMASERSVFEHFTHDASILPMDYFPAWQWQFGRMKQRMAKRTSWSENHPLCAEIKARIADEGPLSTHAFDTKIEGEKQMWARPPHKRALDYMWYTGELTTSHREKFTKFYDLTDRVIPEEARGPSLSETDQFDWLCREALGRLSFATCGELQDFWGAASSAQMKAWLAANPSEHVPVEVQTASGDWTEAYGAPDLEARVEALGSTSSRLRILSPFDPLIRNRKRLERIFGFDYRIEIFVPAAKRRWGYYVYPILEGARLVGRIEAKADRSAGTLSVLNFWPEPGVSWSAARYGRLESELSRLARFIGAELQPWR